MTNHLAGASSPYLLQHAANPVDWYPWGQAALDRAKRENKPIFLSIGYAACHWCHVMAHESFEDARVAEFMNQHFVAIKVDREERPDLDAIYMNAVVTLNGQGGWPLSLFLTPDGRPFYGGTYFPPQPRFSLPSFSQVIQHLSDLWKKDPAQVERAAAELVGYLQRPAAPSLEARQPDDHFLDHAARAILEQYDWEAGGWGGAPKFPQPMVLEFLLNRAAAGEDQAMEAVSHCLRAMSQGGMADLAGGGFHRYSTDAHWLVPHYEKMLYDNAQLALVYLHAHCLTGAPAWEQVATDTLDFILRELAHPQGGFYSSLDADSPGGEGSFYTWSAAELRHALPDPEDYAVFTAAHSLDPASSSEGRFLLRRAGDRSASALPGAISPSETAGRLHQVYQALRRYRQARPHPAVDDKIITAWNGLALTAFAQAAAYLGREDYLDAARKNATFLLDHLQPEGHLLRSWRQGTPGPRAFLEDHAGLCLGLLSLYQVDADLRWYTAARRLADDILAHFTDPEGGFFDTPDSSEPLLVRPKELQDNATPSGGALAAHAILRLQSLSGDLVLPDAFYQNLEAVKDPAARYPLAFGYWLSVLDFYLAPVTQVAILTPTAHPAQSPLAQVFWETYRPHAMLASSAYPPPAGSPGLLADRPLVADQATAYVCERFQCRLPVTGADQLRELIDPHRLSLDGKEEDG